MASARHRNKNAAPESNSQAAAGNDVAKKTPKANKGSSSSSSSSSRRPGVFSKLLSCLFYAVVVAVAACTGWLVYSLLEEVSVMSSKLGHLSDQKGELAETVYTLQKQVDLLEKAVGRVEFISKDIQEKQQRHDTSIKNCEKELDVVGVILKKLQKDLSTVIQDVKDQGDRDLDLFDQTMREKFTELNNSINEDLAELAEVQKSSQEELNNVKAKIASLGDLNAISDDLKSLKELTSELKSSFKSKEESIDWLMNNALNMDSVTANSNQIEILKNEQDNLKRDVEEQKVAVKNMRENILTTEDSSLKGELDRVLKEFEQIASSVKEMEGNYISANNDLLKEIETNRDSMELRLKPLESIMNSDASALGSLKDSFEEYNRRINAVEEAITGLKHLSSDGQGSPEVSETLSTLKEAQQALSQKVDELRSSMTALPNSASDFEKLQVEVTSVLEGHKLQVDELKDDYEKLKSSVGSSEQASGIDGLSSSIKKLESDLQMMRGAVDSLVAYSVKTEIHENDLRSVKETLEDLKESTDKLLVKYEQIQESV
ncbi:LOW QUALITY PROTEIN: cytoskeleton-associated protein 4 [Bufo gargarizans]|uniref:LOW QUALITY PROTEIN: cytoskeleton-associated protein 4 n=1 Tax=Bufo gargarizans TaxID=30331 RepID=UPI001CF216C2|nr:LOW QUALITY PROTEIN: cytoskeleton-associated protein 4 [Bufo gargarizans]